MITKKMPCKKQGYRNVWCTVFCPFLIYTWFTTSAFSLFFTNLISAYFVSQHFVFLMIWQFMLLTAYNEAVTWVIFMCMQLKCFASKKMGSCLSEKSNKIICNLKVIIITKLLKFQFLNLD